MPIDINAQKIIDTVYEVCPFGPTNYGPAKESFRAFCKLKQAITNVFHNPKEVVKKSILKSAQDPFAILMKMASIHQQGKLHGSYLYLPPETMFDSDTFDIVTKAYPPKKLTDWATNQDTINVNYLSAVLAQHLWEYDAKIVGRSDEIKHKILTEEEINIYGLYLATKTEPKTEEKQLAYFKGLISDTRYGAVIYGSVNCAGMADIAFLVAVYQNIPHDITYLRLTNSQGKNIEELNVIAIGDWECGECLIVNPWHKKFSPWQGSIANTDALKTNHDKVEVLFRCSADCELRNKCIDLLNTHQYSSWLTVEDRVETFKRIQKVRNEFISRLTDFGYIPAPEPQRVSTIKHHM